MKAFTPPPLPPGVADTFLKVGIRDRGLLVAYKVDDDTRLPGIHDMPLYATMKTLQTVLEGPKDDAQRVSLAQIRLDVRDDRERRGAARVLV